MQLENPDTHPNSQASIVHICNYNVLVLITTHMLAMYIKNIYTKDQLMTTYLLKTNPRLSSQDWRGHQRRISGPLFTNMP